MYGIWFSRIRILLKIWNISGALEVEFEGVNVWTDSGIRGKLYRNQIVPLELRLKTMCSEAVSHSSLSHTPWKYNLKNKTSLDIIFLLWYSIQCRKFLTSRYFSPLQQISMGRNAINRRSDLARRELENPTPHQFYVQKEITSTCFNPLIVPKKLATWSFPALRMQTQTNVTTKIRMRRIRRGGKRPWGLRDGRINERLIWKDGRGRSKGRELWEVLVFFGLYGLLFHTITTTSTIRCAIVCISTNISASHNVRNLCFNNCKCRL